MLLGLLRDVALMHGFNLIYQFGYNSSEDSGHLHMSKHTFPRGSSRRQESIFGQEYGRSDHLGPKFGRCTRTESPDGTIKRLPVQPLGKYKAGRDVAGDALTNTVWGKLRLFCVSNWIVEIYSSRRTVRPLYRNV